MLAWSTDVGWASSQRTLLLMTALIVLFAVTVLFALALRPSRPKAPPLPAGYDGERQLAELRALTGASPHH